MACLGNVQQKISCVFETKVVEEPSEKRKYQPYRIIATDSLRESTISCDIHSATASEKLDGTCVLIQEFDGKPWLWARHDRKPTKMADRKFKKFKAFHNAWEVSGKQGNEPVFVWNLENDIKDVPKYWEPGTCIKKSEDGHPMPDVNGHIPGWVPIASKSRQHCWHESAVDMDSSIALILAPTEQGDDADFKLSIVPLSRYNNATLELIGTHINGNPYMLGSKVCPLHILVRHGSVHLSPSPPLCYPDLQIWMKGDFGRMEGVVWHCQNGSMFKAHRHHLGLHWPLSDNLPRLSTCSVRIDVDLLPYEDDFIENAMFHHLSKLHGQLFQRLTDIFKNDADEQTV